MKSIMLFFLFIFTLSPTAFASSTGEEHNCKAGVKNNETGEIFAITWHCPSHTPICDKFDQYNSRTGKFEGVTLGCYSKDHEKIAQFWFLSSPKYTVGTVGRIPK